MWLVLLAAADLSLGGYFLQIDLLGLDPYEVPLRKSHSITTSNELSSFANCSGCFQGPNDELARLRKIRWSRGMISVVWTGDRRQGRAGKEAGVTGIERNTCKHGARLCCTVLDHIRRALKPRDGRYQHGSS